MNFIDELDQCFYAGEQLTQSGNQSQPETPKTVEQRLQEAILRNNGNPLSETFLEKRLNEQQSIEDFQRMKMDLLGANTEHRDLNYEQQLAQQQQQSQPQVPVQQPGQPDVASVQDKMKNAETEDINSTKVPGVPNARQV